MLTSMPREQLIATLNDLISPFGALGPADHWAPGGFKNPAEARLDDPGNHPFVPSPVPWQLKRWWLRQTRHAQTPNWDLVSTCTINNQPGLLLVEAKAHEKELDEAGKRPGNAKTHEQIEKAIREANIGLESILSGWDLSLSSHYQLANRFAWAWKLAAIGVPTVLLHLGFLRAEEMADLGCPFTSAKDWETAIRRHAAGVVPKNAWERPLRTPKAPMYPLIRSLDIKWIATMHKRRGTRRRKTGRIII